MATTYTLTLLSEGAGSGPYYVVTYTTGSVYGPVQAGSPAYLPNVGSTDSVTIAENIGSFSYLAFKLNNGTGGDCELCNNSVIYTVTGSAPTGSCCAPTLDSLTITGSQVQISFTTGSSPCLNCGTITIETSTNGGSTWSTAQSNASCTASYLYTTSSVCSNQDVYFRLYQNCIGGTTSSYSNTGSIAVTGSGFTCCTPSITSLAVSASVTSSLILTYQTGSGVCCLSCSFITFVSSSDGGSTYGGDFTGSCGGGSVVVVGPPVGQTYYYKVQQTCSGSVTSSLSGPTSYENPAVPCGNVINVDNNATGGFGITSVTINGVAVSYVSGDNFTIDSGEFGAFTSNETGASVSVTVCYTSHTGDKHINLTDCANPAGSYCCDNLDTAGACCTFEGITLSCTSSCTLTIEANDGGCI